MSTAFTVFVAVCDILALGVAIYYIERARESDKKL